MAQNDLWRRYLDAGLQFTQMTRERAEAIVRDLVEQGQVQAEQTQSAIEELVDRSRNNTERLLDTVRSEVRSQLMTAEVVTKDVATRMQTQIDELRAQLSGVASTGRGASRMNHPGSQQVICVCEPDVPALVVGEIEVILTEPALDPVRCPDHSMGLGYSSRCWGAGRLR